jgi:predicted small lipoprotein YifL
MKRLTILIAILACVFIVSGCGQSGPLYIPGNPSTMAVPPSQQTAADEESEEEQDSNESPEAD